MDASGNLQEDVVVAKLSADKPKEKVQALVNQCKSEQGASSCETSFKMYQCFRKNVEF